MIQPYRQIGTGNCLLELCFCFYLAWWLLAFRPERPVRGVGWLLIPALVAGIAGAVQAGRGVQTLGTEAPVPLRAMWLGGAVAYVLLLAWTWGLLKRPVTTELILLVAWAAFLLAEADVLAGSGHWRQGPALLFAAVVLVAFAVSMVCYVRYYHLDSRDGYVCGAIPLVLGLVLTAVPILA